MLKQVIVELTNACNANCVMCLRRHMKRPVKHMELDLLTKIIDEVEDKELATYDNPIGLCGIGEPTLHPQLLNILNIVKRVPFGFGTNCENLTQEISQSLIDAKFTDFNLSIDAYSAQSHGQIKPGLSFHNVFLNTRRFLDLLKGKDFWKNISIQFIVLDLNVDEVRDFIFFWLNLTKDLPQVTIYIKPVCEWPSSNGATQHYPSPNKFRRVESERVIYGEFDKIVQFRDSCQMFDTFAQIQSDGSYSPCCMNSDDEYKVGNIRYNSIEELFNSDQMNFYREKFNSKSFDEIPYCKDCSKYELDWVI